MDLLRYWEYIGFLGSGATSYVFSGVYKGKNVALKWVTGKKELQNIKKIQECIHTFGGGYLLTPTKTSSGEIFLEDIVGKVKILPVLKLTNGPPLVKDKNTTRHYLKGSKLAYLFVFPMMTGSLDNIRLSSSERYNVLKDMTMAIKFLEKCELSHADIALRNIFFCDIPNGRLYYLGDFGKMSTRVNTEKSIAILEKALDLE